MARRNGRRPQHVVAARPDARGSGHPRGDGGARPASADAQPDDGADEGLGLFDADERDEPQGSGATAAQPGTSDAARPPSRPVTRVLADPFGPPASVLAPRVALAALLTSVIASVLGALAVVVYTDATDPQGVDAGTWVSDLARTAGVAALVGLGLGVLVALLSAWAAMALRRQLIGPLRRSRLLALLGTVVFWALAVLVLLHMVGFGGLGALGFAVGLPGLLVALVLAWLLTPWALRGARDDTRGV